MHEFSVVEWCVCEDRNYTHRVTHMQRESVDQEGNTGSLYTKYRSPSIESFIYNIVTSHPTVLNRVIDQLHVN